MLVHDKAMGDREGGEGMMAARGGGSQGGRMRRDSWDAVVGGVAVAVGDNGEDGDGIRQHKATTNPVMATVAAVADDDGDGERRRR